MLRCCIAATTLLAGFALSSAHAQSTRPAAPTTRFVDNIDESKAGNFPLPDALLLPDGQRVTTAEQWYSTRRPQLLQLFAQNVYGVAPAAPPAAAEKFDDNPTGDGAAFGGLAKRKQVRVSVDVGSYIPGPRVGPPVVRIDTLIYTPASANAPVPLILCLSFYPLHEVTTDPAVQVMGGYNRYTQQPEPGKEADRGKVAAAWPIQKILSRGYGVALVYYQQIEPDAPGDHTFGLRATFRSPGAPSQSDTWGTTAAWAWGASRVMDDLQTDHDIDPHRIAIMGHSRLGKTAMWIGATDERFAMILGAQPGRGGAAPARRNYGESIVALTTRFGYQFCPAYAAWAKHPQDMPIDSNELIDLLAPRPFYQTASVEDRHSDPKGQFMAEAAAGPVYQLLGAQGLGNDQMPGLDQPIMHTLGFHYRPGKHEVTAYDWEQFLKFADLHFGRAAAGR